MTLSQSRRSDLCCPVNRLYFGDNVKRLRTGKKFPDASVDLVYLDPVT
jgi:hypothetical protein